MDDTPVTNELIAGLSPQAREAWAEIGAAVVLGDSLRGEEVREDLGRELGKREEV